MSELSGVGYVSRETWANMIIDGETEACCYSSVCALYRNLGEMGLGCIDHSTLSFALGM
jgi:hypothetical protein